MKGIQGYIGLKFHLDTMEVGEREGGVSYNVQEFTVSEN